MGFASPFRDVDIADVSVFSLLFTRMSTPKRLVQRS